MHHVGPMDYETCAGCGGAGWITIDHGRIGCPNCNPQPYRPEVRPMLLRAGSVHVVLERVVAWYHSSEEVPERLVVQVGPQEWYFDGAEGAAVEKLLVEHFGPVVPVAPEGT